MTFLFLFSFSGGSGALAAQVPMGKNGEVERYEARAWFAERNGEQGVLGVCEHKQDLDADGVGEHGLEDGAEFEGRLVGLSVGVWFD